MPDEWVLEHGWVLTWNDYDECTILGIFTANFRSGKPEVIRRLKQAAYNHRHPRQGKDRLVWGLEGTEWTADGNHMGSYYLIAPHKIEMLFD